ncbi:MAG TPA: Calx-beta domain-containing protein [Acidimicrobiales bacterium]|nr:Calx-beta domain-containing protein [Acidimicrobiales bacterium]
MKQGLRLAVVLGLLATALAVLPAAGPAQGAPRLDTTYGRLPLAFEANRGQTDPEVAFLSRGNGFGLFLSADQAVLSLARVTPEETSPSDPLGESDDLVERTVVGMELVGADPGAEGTGRDPLPGRSNYFVGNDPARWQTGIPSFATVSFADVYPGIDVVYYGNEGALEYDFVVAPGTSFEDIAIRILGADRITIDESGDLVLDVPGGEVRQRRPVVYQKVDGRRQSVPSSFVIRSDETVGFDVGGYDTDLPLVIDPVLAYATFLGGSGAELGSDIAVNDAGAAYLTGITSSADFPDSFGKLYQGGDDAFVAKLSPDGSRLEYATYLGGDDEEKARSIAIDDAGNAYVAGSTDSTNVAGTPFPTTPGAYNSVPGGQQDIYVTKLDGTGAMVWSTFLGGDSNDGRANVTVDGAGTPYVAGYTKASNFKTTEGAFQSKASGKADIVVVKLKPDGSGADYATYVGGNHHDTGRGIAIDGAGHAYVCGWSWSDNFPTTGAGGAPAYQSTRQGPGDIVVFKLAPDGKTMVYSTLVGGNRYDWPYLGSCIDVDEQGNAHVTGYTDSPDFPLVNPARPAFGGGSADAFAIKVNPTGTGLIYSTYLGGTAHDEGIAVAVDGAGNAHYTGFTESRDFTPIVDPVQASFGGSQDAFVTKMGPAGGEPIYSTYVGGSRQDHGRGIDTDAQDNAYVIGHSESDANFPIRGNPVQPSFGGSKDVVVFKLDASGDPPPTTTTSGLTTTTSTTSPSSTSTTSTSTTSPSSTSTTSTTAPGVPSLSISDTTVTEGDSGTLPATFDVTLSPASSQTVRVKYRTQGVTATANQDFFDTSGTLTFAPGETSKTITVAVAGDVTTEPDETFQVQLGKESGAIVAKRFGTGTILDNDGGSPTPTTTSTTSPPPTTEPTTAPTTAPSTTSPPTTAAGTSLSIADASVIEGNARTTFAGFQVTLSAASSQTVTVKYRTQGDTATANQDFFDTSGTLTFAPGETSKTIAVAVAGDERVEGNETFLVELGKESGATVARRVGTGTIVDDD